MKKLIILFVFLLTISCTVSTNNSIPTMIPTAYIPKIPTSTPIPVPTASYGDKINYASSIYAMLVQYEKFEGDLIAFEQTIYETSELVNNLYPPYGYVQVHDEYEKAVPYFNLSAKYMVECEYSNRNCDLYELYIRKAIYHWKQGMALLP